MGLRLNETNFSHILCVNVSLLSSKEPMPKICYKSSLLSHTKHEWKVTTPQNKRGWDDTMVRTWIDSDSVIGSVSCLMNM